MARLSKESEKKINMIIRMASSQVHAALGKLYGISRKINVLVKKELQEADTDKTRMRQAFSEAHSLWLKCSNIYNKVYKEGARGLEIHAALKDIRRSVQSLNSLVDNPYIIGEETDQLLSTINDLEGMVAKTGHVEAISPSVPKSEPKSEKVEIPSSLRFVISKLSAIVDDESVPDEVNSLSRAFLGKIVSAIKVGGNDYYELIANDSSEAKEMLSSVMQAMRRYNPS